MDFLEYEDKHYQRRKTDLENYLYKTYDKVDEVEIFLVNMKDVVAEGENKNRKYHLFDESGLVRK